MKINSKVRFLNQQGGGVIISIQGDKCVVLDENELEWPVSVSEVVEIGLDPMEERQKIYAKGNRGADHRQNTVSRQSSRTGGKGFQKKEIDLHQNALTGYSPSMTSIEVHELQLRTIRDTLEKEKKHHGAQIIFIHGKGEGVLRSELIQILKRFQSVCRYEDAPFHTYGFQGAIKVTIK